MCCTPIYGLGDGSCTHKCRFYDILYPIDGHRGCPFLNIKLLLEKKVVRYDQRTRGGTLRRYVLFISMTFTIILSVMLAFSLMRGAAYSYASWTEGISLLLVWIPPILSWTGTIDLPWPISLGAGVALSLHSYGILSDLYDSTLWFSHFAHLIFGIVVAMLVATILMIVVQQANHLKKTDPLDTFLRLHRSSIIGRILEDFEYTYGPHLRNNDGPRARGHDERQSFRYHSRYRRWSRDRILYEKTPHLTSSLTL